MVLLAIKPRLQKEKWSLYWKCSMATRTFYLDEFDLDVDITKVTARELKKQIAERVGLPPVKDLFRLEGFQEPWELMCVSFSSCSSSFKCIYIFLSISTRFSCAFFLELTNSLLLLQNANVKKKSIQRRGTPGG